MILKKNPDKKYVEEMQIALKNNDNYCPCSISKNSDTKCMCKDFRTMLVNKQTGYCHCKLYYVTFEDEVI